MSEKKTPCPLHTGTRARVVVRPRGDVTIQAPDGERLGVRPEWED